NTFADFSWACMAPMDRNTPATSKASAGNLLRLNMVKPPLIETCDRETTIAHPSDLSLIRGMGRTRRGGRVRWHPRRGWLIDRIINERLLGAEQVPDDATHEQEHRQQHSEEKTSGHGSSSDN